ncbi:DUF4288 domain-containing protein [Pedobacter aquatilis]|uniref:DUF4288 domain-containing protein n=1 Tax=Pedobacter aquatilis TaxID=351343 RepID=UPI002931AD9F|nr:DUF4288 domain-containing protein [Pedobacter aquatilis]
MKWFAVNCIYQVICGEGKHSPQFNEQVRLVTAETSFEAIQKAKLLAFGYNASFENCVGEMVRWEFIAVGGITAVDEPTDGIEVSSKILEPKSVEAYLKDLKHRTKTLTELNK